MAANNENFTIRVPADLRDDFKEACARQDMTASQLVRRWMRDFVESDQQGTLARGVALGRQNNGKGDAA